MYDLNDTTKYTVWVCQPNYPDQVYASGLTLWDAEFVINELNSIDELRDYRISKE
jgi:hypothetical protein